MRIGELALPIFKLLHHTGHRAPVLPEPLVLAGNTGAIPIIPQRVIIEIRVIVEVTDQFHLNGVPPARCVRHVLINSITRNQRMGKGVADRQRLVRRHLP